MSNETPIAKYRFINYLITNTTMRFTGKEPSGNMIISINPKGLLNQEKKTFELTLNVELNDNEKNLDLSMTIRAFFEYDAEDVTKIRKIISFNSPAILFPYIRAYISSVTALGGIRPIIIPTLNLENIGKDLLKKLEENDK